MEDMFHSHMVRTRDCFATSLFSPLILLICDAIAIAHHFRYTSTMLIIKTTAKNPARKVMAVSMEVAGMALCTDSDDGCGQVRLGSMRGIYSGLPLAMTSPSAFEFIHCLMVLQSMPSLGMAMVTRSLRPAAAVFTAGRLGPLRCVEQ